MPHPNLTIFTPTYNRAHTLIRTYESLCTQTCMDFEWIVVDDGSTDDTGALVKSWQQQNRIPIRYIYKSNGGLFTGYNTAFEAAETELIVCIDSDDYMPAEAVEWIINKWRKDGGAGYCGIVGLDFSHRTMRPLGGYFPEGLSECYFIDLHQRGIHCADSKLVLRVDLVKQVAPQIGFPGEKFFNPNYMQLQVCDKLPILVLNEALCIVDYQINDSMSKAIYKQYINSPHSFAKGRRIEMSLKHCTLKNKFRQCVHYVAETRLAKERDWLKNCPYPLIALLMWPLGQLLYYHILNKNKATN